MYTYMYILSSHNRWYCQFKVLGNLLYRTLQYIYIYICVLRVSISTIVFTIRKRNNGTVGDMPIIPRRWYTVSCPYFIISMRASVNQALCEDLEGKIILLPTSFYCCVLMKRYSIYNKRSRNNKGGQGTVIVLMRSASKWHHILLGFL